MLAVAPCVYDTIPGIVYALTAPRTATPVIALIPTPAVSRLSIRVAALRARILVSVVLSVSMVLTVAPGAESYL